MYHGQNLQSLTGKSDVSIGEKFLRGTKKNLSGKFMLCGIKGCNRCNLGIFTQSSVREYELYLQEV